MMKCLKIVLGAILFNAVVFASATEIEVPLKYQKHGTSNAYKPSGYSHLELKLAREK